MNDQSQPSDPYPALRYLDALHARLNPEEFDVVLRLVRSLTSAAGAQRAEEPAERGPVTQKLRDEASTVVALAFSGQP